MILQALTNYYQTLVDRGKIVAPGWGQVNVSYALCIDGNGHLEQVISVKTEQLKGKKTVLGPRVMTLPMPVKRSSGVAASFLCDNSSYFLGVDNKGKPQRSLACFHACKQLHEDLLANVDSPAARAGIRNKQYHILSFPLICRRLYRASIWYFVLIIDLCMKTF